MPSAKYPPSVPEALRQDPLKAFKNLSRNQEWCRNGEWLSAFNIRLPIEIAMPIPDAIILETIERRRNDEI
jgi:hypothetical protein